MPAHAGKSVCVGTIYDLEIVFTEVDCDEFSEFFFGFTDEEIINQSVKPGPSESFCISDKELTAGEFNRNIDLSGEGANNPVADFIFVTYTINTATNSMLSETVATSNVDTLVSLAGTWTAVAA